MTPALERLALIPVDPGTKQPFGGFIFGKSYTDFAPGINYIGKWGGETGHVMSQSVNLVAVDIDGTKAFDDGTAPTPFHETELGNLLGGSLVQHIVTYVRADGEPKSHLYIVPPEGTDDWPVQWSSHYWSYDWKSKGFCRAEPAYRYTGVAPLKAGPNLWAQIVNALRIDQFEFGKQAAAHNEARKGTVRNGKSVSEWMEEAGYATYADIPDNSVAGDNDLSALVGSMYSLGVDLSEMQEHWERVSHAETTPYTAADYERHLRGAERKYGASREEALSRRDDNELMGDMKESLPSERSTTALVSHFAGEAEEDEGIFSGLAAGAETVKEDKPNGVLRNGTDQFLAQQLLGIAGREYQRTKDTGAWFRYQGDHWLRVPEDPCDEIVARIAATLKPPEKNTEQRIAEGTAGKDDPLQDDEKLFARLNMSKQASGIITKMKAVAKSRAEVMEENMDADPSVFWAGGTPYDLRTCEPSPHAERVHLLTAGYAPAEGDTPLWDGLNAAQFPEEDVREYALNVFSSILPGGAGKLLPNFKADGNLAKTTRLMMLVDVLGSYAEQLPVQLLGNYSGHDEMYLRLKGKRLAYMDETPPSGKVATEKLKHLSGGGKLTGRAINGRTPITFTMMHTLFLAGNDDLPLGDPNVQRRIRYLPITGTKAEIAVYAKRIWNPAGGSFSEEWVKEAPAVLWKLMLRAAAVLRDRSLCDMPAGALSCFADAIMEQDNISRFVRDCCEPGGETAGSSLYEAYVSWCSRNAIRTPDSNTAFGRRLNDMGHKSRKTTLAYVRPLKLKPYIMP